MKHIKLFEEHLRESSERPHEDAEADDQLLDVIMKYVKDPDEAEKYAYDVSKDSWPAGLVASVERDPAYQKILKK